MIEAGGALAFQADVTRLRLRGHGRGRARPLRSSRLPRQQRRDRQPRIRRRRERGELAAADGGQRRQHVSGGQARDSGHAPRRRRGDRQRVVDLRPAAARAHRVLRLQGRRHRADAGDGGRSRTRGHPGELRGARARLHAHGLPARHERRRARPAPQGVGAGDRRHRLGHRPRRAVSCSRTSRATSPATRSWWTAGRRCRRRRATPAAPEASRAARSAPQRAAHGIHAARIRRPLSRVPPAASRGSPRRAAAAGSAWRGRLSSWTSAAAPVSRPASGPPARAA